MTLMQEAYNSGSRAWVRCADWERFCATMIEEACRWVVAAAWPAARGRQAEQQRVNMSAHGLIPSATGSSVQQQLASSPIRALVPQSEVLVPMLTYIRVLLASLGLAIVRLYQ